MRRSSAILLSIALALLMVATVGYLFASNPSAPPMTPIVAQDFLDRGKRMLEARDVDGIMSLFSSDARIFGRSASQMRPVIEQVLREVGSQPLSVGLSHLDVHQNRDGALISLHDDISQRLARADASYYRPRLHFVLHREKVSRLLGLFSSEEWRIR